ncbi:Stp1/IreP family PP2C-type Ser/Thr phosphatase [Kroppenstedtia eburnea]|uniref:Protein phosphatase n=1 Tax=Kroppenstedtia eburnea TaxID=714067 RepID=A0A1N7J1Z9_9BACL|nr:Stp1/IreP family PP2C-type Ser/Thr phosphatase [Kroppenstedtia eburnea]EGK13311.1 serine/threonine protein phosphatase 1 [Desmospora sp. 8437]QKI82434.1 Stp1/IreP family PP2C-type Ser/Thr phosphatase [Kroppenstedtia eburnea]SIS43363.1 protein phosphatase [Kroppenstedtia eburnea]
MEKAWLTHEGRVREHNEDSVGLFQSDHGVPVAVLADGMGGHQAGEVASRTAVQVIRRELSGLTPGTGTEERRERMLKAVTAANREIYELASRNKGYKGMGTTVIAAVPGKDEVTLAHVGDSRAYLLHEDGLYQLTEDHSLVNVLKQHGEITEEEARVHPQRNVIVRSVGTNEEVETDLIVTPWYIGDILLICSDGLCDMVPVDVIGTILTSPLPLREQANRLLESALEAGGKDNISVILIKNDGLISKSD